MQLRDGDLLRHKVTGALRQVKGEQFTKRYMDAQDYEMAAHGMGHMAGVYCGAIQTIALDIESHGGMVGAMYVMKLSTISRSWLNLTAQEEANEAA
jgi:hypothetical protein